MSLNDTLRRMRDAEIAESGAPMDEVSSVYHCDTCGEDRDDATITRVIGTPYPSFAALAAVGERTARGRARIQAGRVTTEDAPKPAVCSACGHTLRLLYADFLAYHPILQRDMVARGTPGADPDAAVSVTLHWWDVDGAMTPIDVDAEADDARMDLVDMLREVGTFGLIEPPDPEEFRDKVTPLVERYALDPAILLLVPSLMDMNLFSIAGPLLQDYLEVYPDDAAALAYLGEIIVMLTNAGHFPREQMGTAQQMLEASIDIEPENYRALKALAVCHRAADDFDRARHCLDAAVLLRPDDDVLRYDLGALYLQLGNGAEALQHFQAGEELAESDPDYPIGCARAYLLLGDAVNARAALERGRALAPEHPRIADVEAALAAR